MVKSIKKKKRGLVYSKVNCLLLLLLYSKLKLTLTINSKKTQTTTHHELFLTKLNKFPCPMPNYRAKEIANGRRQFTREAKRGRHNAKSSMIPNLDTGRGSF